MVQSCEFFVVSVSVEYHPTRISFGDTLWCKLSWSLTHVLLKLITCGEGGAGEEAGAEEGRRHKPTAANAGGRASCATAAAHLDLRLYVHVLFVVHAQRVRHWKGSVRREGA
jgi:hypothetical protein